jgi:hypothetical protein
MVRTGQFCLQTTSHNKLLNFDYTAINENGFKDSDLLISFADVFGQVSSLQLLAASSIAEINGILLALKCRFFTGNREYTIMVRTGQFCLQTTSHNKLLNYFTCNDRL